MFAKCLANFHYFVVIWLLKYTLSILRSVIVPQITYIIKPLFHSHEAISHIHFSSSFCTNYSTALYWNVPSFFSRDGGSAKGAKIFKVKSIRSLLSRSNFSGTRSLTFLFCGRSPSFASSALILFRGILEAPLDGCLLACERVLGIVVFSLFRPARYIDEFPTSLIHINILTAVS